MAKIISIMNPKGGVGRTNVAINLAMMLSLEGFLNETNH